MWSKKGFGGFEGRGTIREAVELMFKEIRWLFFDVGSTIMNEQTAYEHRIRDIAAAANTAYETVYERALAYYKMNKKGNLEAAGEFGVPFSKVNRILNRRNIV